MIRPSAIHTAEHIRGLAKRGMSVCGSPAEVNEFIAHVNAKLAEDQAQCLARLSERESGEPAPPPPDPEPDALSELD